MSLIPNEFSDTDHTIIWIRSLGRNIRRKIMGAKGMGDMVH
jgi:hypothetical protein